MRKISMFLLAAALVTVAFTPAAAAEREINVTPDVIDGGGSAGENCERIPGEPTHVPGLVIRIPAQEVDVEEQPFSVEQKNVTTPAIFVKRGETEIHIPSVQLLTTPGISGSTPGIHEETPGQTLLELDGFTIDETGEDTVICYDP